MRGHDKHDPHSRRDADGDGVPDNRDPVVRPAAGVAPADAGLTREVRKDAYERGRADERSRHKRSVLLTILIAVAAALGIIVTFLAIQQGSFRRGGEVIDRSLGQAREQAGEVSREAADEGGEALQDVGRRVEQEGEAGQGGSGPGAAPRQSTAPSTPPAQ